VDRLVGERDRLIKKLGDEQVMVDRVRAAYEKMIAVEPRPNAASARAMLLPCVSRRHAARRPRRWPASVLDGGLFGLGMQGAQFGSQLRTSVLDILRTTGAPAHPGLTDINDLLLGHDAVS
jgi:hypothetical protein